MKQPMPSFKTDAEAEEFVATADLSDFDLSGARLVRFELKPTDRSINLRLPEPLLAAVRAAARRAGLPYQRYIRLALEQAVHPKP